MRHPSSSDTRLDLGTEARQGRLRKERVNLSSTRSFRSDRQCAGKWGKWVTSLQSNPATAGGRPWDKHGFFFKRIKFIGNKRTNCMWLSSLKQLIHSILPDLLTFKFGGTLTTGSCRRRILLTHHVPLVHGCVGNYPTSRGRINPSCF